MTQSTALCLNRPAFLILIAEQEKEEDVVIPTQATIFSANKNQFAFHCRTGKHPTPMSDMKSTHLSVKTSYTTVTWLVAKWLN